MNRAGQFVLLNILALAAIVCVGVLAPNTPALKFLAVSAVAVAFLNYSLAQHPRLIDRLGSEETRRRAWKNYRSTLIMALVWIYLIIAWDRIGLIIAAVTATTLIVVAGVVWIAEKSAGP